MKMNLQLFGYDDGFYYGQCKLICETETTAGNGKTVTISGNGRTWSGTVSNKLCSFLVPGRGQYTISLMNGGTTLWSGTVEAGYGECIHVMLADGYKAVMEKSKLTLAEIAASVGSVADYVPDADCVKTLNNNLTANSQQFRFGYDSETQKYGYILKEADTDVFVPFSSIGDDFEINQYGYSFTYTVPYDGLLIISWTTNKIDYDQKTETTCLYHNNELLYQRTGKGYPTYTFKTKIDVKAGDTISVTTVSTAYTENQTAIVLLY